MTERNAPQLAHAHEFYIGGQWIEPTTSERLQVFDSHDGSPCFDVAAAQPADIERAVAAARDAFDNGPWPRMSHTERADYMRALASVLRKRAPDIEAFWPRESGVLSKLAQPYTERAAKEFEFYADLAENYEFERVVQPSQAKFGLLVREPVGVVGAIIPWNGPVVATAHKLAPALLCGCCVVLKSPPEAPAEGLIYAEIADEIGLPPGVFNTMAADREASETLVRDPRVDKISFTGSTAAGRRIGGICGERVARCSLELGGKSPAIVLDDADIDTVADSLSQSACALTGQICASLTRIVVSESRQNDLADALAARFASVRVGDPYDESSQMGPLASKRQHERVLSYIAKGHEQGARLVTGGHQPQGLEQGYYVEPTVFASVESDHVIAQEEIFGPVLSVLPARDEADAIRIANDSIYGLNATVFTPDADRARAVAAQIQSGTVAHNAFRIDFEIAFGGFKQSGIGREGGTEAIGLFTEAKTLLLDDPPQRYAG